MSFTTRAALPLLLALGWCACSGRPDSSRALGCPGFAAPRERELCEAMSRALTWQWLGHATFAPGYKPTLASVPELACALGLSPADVPALEALRDARPGDWRREALASWLLAVVGAGGATGTSFDPTSEAFVLRHGCPRAPGGSSPARGTGSQRPDAGP